MGVHITAVDGWCVWGVLLYIFGVTAEVIKHSPVLSTFTECAQMWNGTDCAEKVLSMQCTECMHKWNDTDWAGKVAGVGASSDKIQSKPRANIAVFPDH